MMDYTPLEPTAGDEKIDRELLDTVRSILITPEREQIGQIDHRTEDLRD